MTAENPRSPHRQQLQVQITDAKVRNRTKVEYAIRGGR